MGCEDARDLIHSLLDDELDPLSAREVQRHIEQCRDCSGASQLQQALHSALAGASLRYSPPPDLAARIRTGLTHADRQPRAHWRMPALWAGAALALVLLSLATLRTTAPPAPDLAAEEVLAGHIRSLMPGHLTDVTSSDTHNVKPWFNGRLDFATSVPDLSSSGFVLIGGRLDYLQHRPVAALVYRRRQHFINVFVWPAAGRADTRPASQTLRGYHLVHWTAAAMNWWAVSDLNPAELQQFVALIRR